MVQPSATLHLHQICVHWQTAWHAQWTLRMSASLAQRCSLSLWLAQSTGICISISWLTWAQVLCLGWISIFPDPSARSYDGHVFVCLPTHYAEWPQDAGSISPAKEIADAVKLAQKTAGSVAKMKVTVCQGLDGEDGDILFFPPKSGIQMGASTQCLTSWPSG